jgi:hypothetical protein
LTSTRPFSGAERLRLVEFKIEQQGLPEHEWWLDDIGAEPRGRGPLSPGAAAGHFHGALRPEPLAGPTLVHYAHPLAPYLMGAVNLSQLYVDLHRDAQEEYHSRYGGAKGPILPVHTRNDLENIALCGEENFGKFCWWPKYRDYGKLQGYWPFNDSPPTPANTATTRCGWGPRPTPPACASRGTPAPFAPGSAISPWRTTPAWTSAGIYPGGPGIPHRRRGDGRHPAQRGHGRRGYGLGRGADNKFSCVLNGAVAVTSPGAYPKDQWYYVVAARTGSSLKLYVNGVEVAAATYGTAIAPDANPLYLGLWNNAAAIFSGALDFVRIHARGMDASEIAGRWAVIQGTENGSNYPEVGHALGQYWAFYRLAQFYFISNDPGARAILDNWLAWLDLYGAPDGERLDLSHLFFGIRLHLRSL